MTRKTDYRRMTNLEKKEARKLKKAKKEAKSIKKKLNTTLSWMDVLDVGQDYILIGKDKKRSIIKGIKLSPHNIFIDDVTDQQRNVERLERCLNNCPDHLYYSFVYSPVNMDSLLNNLDMALVIEEDPTCVQMIQDDLNKAMTFQKNYRELDFYVMIRDSNEERLTKRLNDLFVSFSTAGFLPSVLNKKDYYNYLSYLFENPLINDYHFNRGIFSYLNEEMMYNQDDDIYQMSNHTEDFSEYGEPIVNIRPSSNLIRRSRLAPTALKIHTGYLEIGEKYVTNLLCMQLPQNYYLGILCDVLTDPGIKVFMATSHLKADYAKLLRKTYQEKLRDLQKTTDPAARSRYEVDLASLQSYIDEVIHRHDVTHNVIIVISVFADSLEQMNTKVADMKQNLTNLGFSLAKAVGMQDQTFRIATPLWVDTNLPQVIQENYGFLLPSYEVAGLWPYVFETLKDPKGFILGYELQCAGLIQFDPFLYKNNPATASQQKRVNANCIVVGQSGSGKTTSMNLVIRNMIKNKVKIIWIDPENKNEAITKKYKGTYIDWGKRNNIINVFDLKPISTEEDEEDQRMWDTEAAIYNVIEDVNTVLQYLFPKMDERTFSLTGNIVFAAFAKVGIRKDRYGRYPSFQNLSTDQMPTFSTFIQCLHERMTVLEKNAGYVDELRLLNNLSINMNRIENEWSIYFNGHTSISIPDDGRQIISFGTRKLFTAQQNLQNALYYIMFTYAWSLCLDDKEYSAFVIDEAHTLILKGNTAQLVSQFFRRSRKYKNAMLLGTQEPRDFADPSVLTDGKAIFNNSVYKLVMSLNKDACEDLKMLERINGTEADLIQDLNQGEALFICGDRRIPIKVLATTAELREMDPNYDRLT